MESQYNSQRIFKNTILLYIRMIVVTVMSFFTVRITLRMLGVEDFGIYNVVGGLVAFLGIISATMSSATQRYLAYSLGKNDVLAYQNSFSLLMIVYLGLSLSLLVIGETVGPWFISSSLNVPHDRVIAAQWVYQFTIFSFCLSLIGAPYLSSIISYERMGVFAYVGLFEAFSKLIVVYLLCIISYDKLIIYAFLNFLVTVVCFLIQYLYCKRNLNGCVFKWYWNKKYFNEIISYTGWNLFGAVSGTLNTAGVSLVLNLFFGPLVNAAKGIADRINGIVVSFSTNFYQSISPQIVKTYASGEIERSQKLVYKSSKLSFFLLLVISLPIICGMTMLLNLWLGSGEVTQDMVTFSRLILVYSLVNVFEQPITMIIRANGNIKKYQLLVGAITLLTIPLCIVFFLLGLPAYWSIISLIIVYFIAWFVRLKIAQYQVGLSIKFYFKHVIRPSVLVLILALGVTILMVYIFDMNEIILTLSCFVFVCASVWFLGLERDEKQIVLDKIPSFFNKRH